MNDFLDWLDNSAPVWAFITVTVLAFLTVMAALIGVGFLTAYALAKGMWLIPVLIWIVIPAYLVARAYVRDRAKGGDK